MSGKGDNDPRRHVTTIQELERRNAELERALAHQINVAAAERRAAAFAREQLTRAYAFAFACRQGTR